LRPDQPLGEIAGIVERSFDRSLLGSQRLSIVT
jgi:hypothetical protein